MRVTTVYTNLRVPDIAEARSFYAGYLGLSDESINMDWVTRFSSPDGDANVQLVTRDATAPEDSVATIRVDDVEAAYDEARERGYQIVHPLTTEPWGVRRFFVRAPDGNVFNIAQHRD
ncbi:VOC family protein [Actinomycetospora endophytica]|uniref:VOC family protein n=1 Tax=Actinomycetospora endophytica TaxID=2291215 RepID=A0ABS8PBJ7_9PSEU|nr:VOC family protein [Actinomycetospora endophytica]MCD2194801.1 VOC family protein [Actinomycetospora endophytica]